MSYKELDLASIITIIIVILLMGRYIGSPIALLISVGYSMQPTLETGDLLVVVKSSYRPGDIVVHCSGLFTCISHRVVYMNSTTVITKGDNNPLPDPPLPRENINYKVTFIVKNYIWIPLLIILLSSLWIRKSATKRSD